MGKEDRSNTVCGHGGDCRSMPNDDGLQQSQNKVRSRDLAAAVIGISSTVETPGSNGIQLSFLEELTSQDTAVPNTQQFRQTRGSRVLSGCCHPTFITRRDCSQSTNVSARKFTEIRLTVTWHCHVTKTG